MIINYKIDLLTDWHVGSGLDSGADADLLVLKDERNLPYIPGKTVKGLLKDSLYEICKVTNAVDEDKVNEVFGFEVDNNKTTEGKTFFSNAELTEGEKQEISANSLSSFLYKNISSTKIESNGIAKKGSLRTIQVCIPVSLYGTINIESEKAGDIFTAAFKWTRNLGVNRNRGLGRCKFILISE
jgi:CRISPR/Cas system CSM-associated protein Csm3 (group 7 of RAMP superfamily)